MHRKSISSLPSITDKIEVEENDIVNTTTKNNEPLNVVNESQKFLRFNFIKKKNEPLSEPTYINSNLQKMY